MIDGKQFASVRKRVLREQLVERGFTQVNSEYVENGNGQLRFVRLAAQKHGHGFDVQISLHLDFLPSFSFMVWPGAPIPKAMCSELSAFNCLIRSPTGAQYYEYGASVEDAERILVEVVGRALERLGQFGELVGDGVPLIKLITPEVLTTDLQLFAELRNARTIEEQNEFSGRMAIRQLIPDWTPHVAPTAIILAFIARHYGFTGLTRQYVDVAKLSDQKFFMTSRHKPYIEEIDV
jgi:hypothetical protein